MAVYAFDTCGKDYDNTTIGQNWSFVNSSLGVIASIPYEYVLQFDRNALIYNSLPVGNTGIYNVTFNWNNNTSGSLNTGLLFAKMACYLNSFSQLVVFNTDTSGVIATTGPITNPAGFHCFEFKWDCTASSLLIRQDDIVIFAGASLPNMHAAGSVTAANFGCAGYGGSMYLACYAVQDLTGDPPFNDLCGEFKTFCLFPTGAGLHTEWTNSFSANNYAQVNSRVAPGDSSYLTSDTVGNIDLYTTGSIPSDVVSIAACAGKINGKKFVGGTRNVAFALYFGSGAPTLGPGNGIASGQYLEYTSVFSTNPATSANWDITDFVSLQIGMEVTS